MHRATILFCTIAYLLVVSMATSTVGNDGSPSNTGPDVTSDQSSQAPITLGSTAEEGNKSSSEESNSSGEKSSE